MWRESPLSDDEIARRKALALAAFEHRAPPPLYRASTMDPEGVLHGILGSAPAKTYYIFAGEDGAGRPRQEVHTIFGGQLGAESTPIWSLNFGYGMPKSPGLRPTIPVMLSGLLIPGTLLAATDAGWMVSVEAPDATLLVTGPGKLPRPLALEPVDMDALGRSELKVSGIEPN